MSFFVEGENGGNWAVEQAKRFGKTQSNREGNLTSAFAYCDLAAESCPQVQVKVEEFVQLERQPQLSASPSRVVSMGLKQG